jgi:hypothetical protein
MLLSAVTLFFSILCILFICYALYKNKIFNNKKIIVIKRHPFYGKYISICKFNHSHQYNTVFVSIDDLHTIGENVIFKEKYNTYEQSDKQILNKIQSFIVSAFSNTITDIQKNQNTKTICNSNEFIDDTENKCGKYCHGNCDNCDNCDG